MKKLVTAFFVMLFIILLFPAAAFAADYDIDGQASIIIPSGNHRVFDSNPSLETTQIICSSANTVLTIDGIVIDLLGVVTQPVISFTGTGNELILQGNNFIGGGVGCAAVSVETGTELTISGSGYLEAIGGNDGAGIGSGNASGTGTIIINGGDIAATSMDSGAGIGGGLNQSGGNITINDGQIYIETDFIGSAGIGGGVGGNGGNITINGGIIDIISGDGAAIGGGTGANGGSILITGGDIYTSTFGSAAGMGGGAGGEAGTIQITGGIVDCYSDAGAGIGSGDTSGADAGTVEITGGTVFGYSDFGGAGIGGGNLSSLSSITITGGTVLGDSLSSCGIGVGENGSGGTIAIGGNALVFAWGDGLYPDIGDSLSSYSISGYAEVFLGENIITDVPTTSHAHEPGSLISGLTMNGVSNAYNFTAPVIPINWETNAYGGYFMQRPAINPQTDSRGSNYLSLIYISLFFLLLILFKCYFGVKRYIIEKQ